MRKRDGEERECEEFEILCKWRKENAWGTEIVLRVKENAWGTEIVLRVKLYFQFLVRCQELEWLD